MAELSIIDIIASDYKNRLSIFRRIVNLDRDEIFVSEVELVIPENVTEISDTRLLPIDYNKINYAARPLVSPAFASGSLSYNPETHLQILIIGLGGSQINNFLHNAFPMANISNIYLLMDITVIELEQEMVKIARKYFGLQQDATQRVLVMDGKKYLQEAAEMNHKFDAIYIDACPTIFPQEEKIMCPISPFLNPKSITNMRIALKASGHTIVFKRRLLNYKRPDIIISEIDLMKPKDHDQIDLATVDTTQLDVDYSTVHYGLQPLVASAFLASTLHFNDNADKQLTEIGLGGSQINNFFHYRFPNMSIQVIEIEKAIADIARQYFGFKEDKYQRINITDGINYIHNCKSQADVLLVDACPTEYPFDTVQLCPVSNFTQPEILKGIYKCLKEKGSLIIKLLLNSSDVEGEAKKIAATAEKVGFCCMTIEMLNYYNRVLLCKKSNFLERSQNRAEVNAKIEEIKAKLFNTNF
uniref:PABS domain-containing protein n=1 Tax=Syphacia muris TaxID=451379 RepID=A0A158R3W5_9BILA